MSDGTDSEFAAFYERLFDRVYNYARSRTGSSSLADEIASDTFSRAFRSWAKFDPRKGDRQTWLFSIAFRAVADHYRSEKRRPGTPIESVADLRDSAEGPSQALELAEERRRLGEALSRLDDREREIVSLRFFAGLTNRAIGELLGLSASNVAVLLFRSVRRMRVTISAVEADHG